MCSIDIREKRALGGEGPAAWNVLDVTMDNKEPNEREGQREVERLEQEWDLDHDLVRTSEL